MKSALVTALAIWFAIVMVAAPPAVADMTVDEIVWIKHLREDLGVPIKTSDDIDFLLEKGHEICAYASIDPGTELTQRKIDVFVGLSFSALSEVTQDAIAQSALRMLCA